MIIEKALIKESQEHCPTRDVRGSLVTSGDSGESVNRTKLVGSVFQVLEMILH